MSSHRAKGNATWQAPSTPRQGEVDSECGAAPSAPHEQTAAAKVRVTLLGGFDLIVNGDPVIIPASSKRLLTYVALTCRAAVPRALVAGVLWPEAPEHCAYANLRSALSRLRSLGRAALDINAAEVRLARGVDVDFHHARALARAILNPEAPDAGSSPRFNVETVEELSTDLLPGWYEDWAVLEAEAWQQLRMHTLEKLAGDFTEARRFTEAVAAAHAAVRADPLRESSQEALIRAHLAEDNPSAALCDFERYEQRLHHELGLPPTPRLRRLVADLCSVARRSRPEDGLPGW